MSVDSCIWYAESNGVCVASAAAFGRLVLCGKVAHQVAVSSLGGALVSSNGWVRAHIASTGLCPTYSAMYSSEGICTAAAAELY